MCTERKATGLYVLASFLFATMLAIMVYSEKLLNVIALMKCDDHHTKKLI